MPAPSPWISRPQPGLSFGLPHRGSYNGWSFGEGTTWPIVRSDGIFDQMALKTQDAQRQGDGQIFGLDSEDKRTITMEIGAGMAELAARCGAHGSVLLQDDPLILPRCAMMRRSDDLELRLDDWMIMARPRRFLAPQRVGEPTTLTVGWEAEDPAIYSGEEREASTEVNVWTPRTSRRPYPREEPGGAVDPERTYRGPQGEAPGSWRYGGLNPGPDEPGLVIVNDGCRETYPRFRITGPVPHPVLVNQRSWELLEVSIDLQEGETLDIDMRRGTIVFNGTVSRYSLITRESTFFSCGPGRTPILYISHGAITHSVATAWWRSAW